VADPAQAQTGSAGTGSAGGALPGSGPAGSGPAGSGPAGGVLPGGAPADRALAGSVLADIAVIGGSGLYEFLAAIDEVVVETPFGRPSDPIVIGEVAGRRVAFLPRHGRDHRFPPHRIPYRANLWALRSIGVRQVIAPSAVGSLTSSYGPGTLAVPDQLADRTTSRAQTFYDEGGAVHVQFADPYCPVGRERAIAAAMDSGWVPVTSGTLVVIEGPRFSTRAESRWYAAQGWTLVGMTALPEAVLARELALCYTTIALVTDTDAGVEEGEGVTQAEVFRVFAANIERLREVLMKVIGSLSKERDCPCPHALDDLTLPFSLP
jgi:5'-methylthioadenosine phosphorylase